MFRRGLLCVWVVASVAMLLFVMGFIFWQLHGMLWAALLYRLAGLAMLSAFSGFLLLGLGSLLASVVHDLCAYCSKEARALRRILSLRARSADSRKRLSEQARQLRFWGRIKRQRILARDDRRQLRSLFLAIDTELKSTRTHFEVERYRSLRKALRHHLKQADAKAMLAIREQCSCR